MDGGRPPLGGAEDDAVGTAAPRARSSPQAAKEAVISLVLGQAGGVERDALMALKLPELVRRALAAGVDGDLLGDAMRLRHAPPTGGAVRLELKVEGMGCEACQLAVAGALQRASGVLDAAADFETGTASLLVQPSWGLELGELAARVEAAGFELDVENVSGAM